MDLSRSENLLGSKTMSRLSSVRVAVLGVGGVGGWCAEALVRTGFRNLTLIDCDVVSPSNVNRQAAALAATIGQIKVEAMKERLLAIVPDCRIEVRNERVVGFSGLEGFDCIVDAIDDVEAKAKVMLGASAADVFLVSSMGAAKRTDPTAVRLMRFDKIEGDGLARAMRRFFRKVGSFPKKRFMCAVSTELPTPIDSLGSVMPVTAAFGMALASEVIRFCRETA